MLGFIKLEENDYKNAHDLAQTCLSKNPKNIFAKFILTVSKGFKNGKMNFCERMLEIANE